MYDELPGDLRVWLTGGAFLMGWFRKVRKPGVMEEGREGREGGEGDLGSEVDEMETG